MNLLFILLPTLTLALLDRPTVPLNLTSYHPSFFRLSFGSCFNIFNMTSPIFHTIRSFHPSLFLWLGDAAYTDFTELSGFVEDTSLDSAYAWSRFEKTLADDGYRAMIDEDGVTVLGTWDDHDFGVNDGNGKFKRKNEYREMFMRFIGEDPESKRAQ
jgi:alkaline phosphatase D